MGKLTNSIVRNGVYYVHVRIPNELVAGFEGKLFITKSLRTKDRREAGRRLHDEMVEINLRFDEKYAALILEKKTSKEQPSPLLPAPAVSFAEIARQHGRAVADKEYADRANLFEDAHADSSRLWKGELITLPESRYFDHIVGEGDLDHIVGYIARIRMKDRVGQLRRMLATGNLRELVAIAREWSPGIDSARELVLARLIARSEIDALEAIIAGEPDAGIVAMSTAPMSATINLEQPVRVVGAGEKNCGQGPRLSLVLAEWMTDKERSGKWAEKTRNEREASVKAFIEVIGDRPVGAYAKADVKQFKEVLFNIPPNAHKKAAYKGLGLVAIAEKASAAGDQKPAVKNVAKKMDAVSSMFFWARKNYDEVTFNPFDGLKPETDSTPREERDPFSLDEMKSIFAAPPFTGARSEHHWLQPGDDVLNSSGKFWVPLIGAYTGARLMEIVQLWKSDIRTDDSGLTYIDINDEGNKTLKTKASRRRIPVHPALVKAGFMEFVANVKNPTDRLFSDIEIGDPSNRASPASKLFVRLIRSTGVKSRKNCFHSFRHSFEDACRNAEIDTAVMNALQGHVEGGMAGRYGKGDYKLERLDAAIKKIRYGLAFEV